jgi:FMN phosphatase YigB (HAD superfamily)
MTKAAIFDLDGTLLDSVDPVPSFHLAFGTSVADRGKDFTDFVRRSVRRKPRRRIRSSNLNGKLSGMRIGPILHPTVLLAFTNGTRLQ